MRDTFDWFNFDLKSLPSTNNNFYGGSKINKPFNSNYNKQQNENNIKYIKPISALQFESTNDKKEPPLHQNNYTNHKNINYQKNDNMLSNENITNNNINNNNINNNNDDNNKHINDKSIYSGIIECFNESNYTLFISLDFICLLIFLSIQFLLALFLFVFL